MPAARVCEATCAHILGKKWSIVRNTEARVCSSLGYDAVADVRQGKYFELDIRAGSTAEAEKVVADVASKVLANPVIESFRIEVAPEGGSR